MAGVSKTLQEAVAEFQALKTKITQAADTSLPCPEGFDFIRILPVSEVNSLCHEVQDLAYTIKKNVGGIAGMQPLLAYNMAIRQLKNKLGTYEIVAMVSSRKKDT